MPDSREHEHLDQVLRDDLGKAARVVADSLDEWLLMAHGVTSGRHNAGLFLDCLADNGMTVIRIGALTESRESHDRLIQHRDRLAAELEEAIQRAMTAYLAFEAATTQHADAAARLAKVAALHPEPVPRLNGEPQCPGCGDPAPCPTRQATQETT